MILEKGKIVGSKKMWLLSHCCHNIGLQLQDQSRKSRKISKHFEGIVKMFTQLNGNTLQSVLVLDPRDVSF